MRGTLLIKACCALLAAAAWAPAQAVAGDGAPFHARDPQTCPDTKAPASGPITPNQAAAYVICAKEHVFSGSLYLVHGITVEVGKAQAFEPRAHGHLSDIDTDQPVYPIRGGFLVFRCEPVGQDNAGHNCTVMKNSPAAGFCYKTAFNDWSCEMSDTINVAGTVLRTKFPPPPQ